MGLWPEFLACVLCTTCRNRAELEDIVYVRPHASSTEQFNLTSSSSHNTILPRNTIFIHGMGPFALHVTTMPLRTYQFIHSFCLIIAVF
jgi:hypothetical protein